LILPEKIRGFSMGRAHHRRLAPALCAVACVAIGMLATTSSALAATTTLLHPQVAWWPTPKPWWSYLLPGGSGVPGGSGLPGGTGSTPPPTGSGSPPPSSSPLPGKSFSGTYTGAGASLDYIGYVPSTYKAGTAVPLVISLHGCTESADQFRQLTQWDRLAEAKGFIVVFPQQTEANNKMKCWNFFQTAHMKRDAGEPALIAGVTRSVKEHYTVDARRTFVDGLSAGGAMSSVMAATYPDVYAAAGIGSGCEYAATAACAGYKSSDPVQAGQQAYAAMGSHARPMPVILFEGDKDTTVPPVNAEQLVQQWQVTDDLADDAQANKSIPSAPTRLAQGQVQNGHGYSVTTYSDSHGVDLIESWLVAGMGHAWSGGCSCAQYADPAGPDETAAMYSFFEKHPMP
jgi:poly(hydroxyalkanoate) depolymerase family esterase